MKISMMNLTTKVLGSGSNPVYAPFNFSLNTLLVVLLAQNPLVVKVEYFLFVLSVENIPLVVSAEY